LKSIELEYIVPIALDIDWPTEKSIISCILEQYENFGIKSFALASPSIGWRSAGYPPREVYEQQGHLFAKVKKALKPYGIKCGWWVATTLKSGTTDEFQPIIKEDGSLHGFASCPLDDNFKRKFAENVALFAKIGKPDFILTEDDFSIRATGGCFCERHLNEFANRMGRYYSREELLSAFSREDEEGFELLKKWRLLMRDSLVGLAERIRKELDKETPEIPMGCNQPGGVDSDGDATEVIMRAMAGERHTPFSRLYGTFYCGVDVKKFPEVMYHPLYTKQHTDENYIMYHETDTYPHTRFFTAGKHVKAMMGIVYSWGFDGSVVQTQQLLDNPNEEKAYGTVIKNENARFNAVNRIAKECSIKGVEIDYDPFWNTAIKNPRTAEPLWANSVSRFGLPYTTDEADVAFWDVRQAKYADNETVLKRLSKGVFLDGDAAKALCERGFGKYIGVEMGEDPVNGSKLMFDLGAREVICDNFFEEGEGRNMPSAHMYAPSGNGRWYEMKITDEKCEVITEAYTFQKKLITPTMTRFENELGGRVVVMSLTLDGNLSQALLNYRRQRLIQRLLLWCCDKYVFVKENPDVFLIVNEPKNSENKEYLGMLTLVNLCADTIEKTEIHLPPHLNCAKDFCILNENGEWEKLSCGKCDDGIEINEKMEYCEPMYILLK